MKGSNRLCGQLSYLQTDVHLRVHLGALLEN